MPTTRTITAIITMPPARSLPRSALSPDWSRRRRRRSHNRLRSRTSICRRRPRPGRRTRHPSLIARARRRASEADKNPIAPGRVRAAAAIGMLRTLEIEMKRTLCCAVALAAVVWLGASPPASAHAVCGNRVFPATLTMDDPGVGDELSLPTIQYLPIPATGGNAAGHSIDYGFEWDKRITQDLGVAINDDYFTQHGGAQNLHGW